MHQKQKIIIGITSLLFGSPIVFLAFRDKQKNNFSIVNQQKEETKDNRDKSSSFIFWMAIIFLIVITVIIYKKIKKKNSNKFIISESKYSPTNSLNEPLDSNKIKKPNIISDNPEHLINSKKTNITPDGTNPEKPNIINSSKVIKPQINYQGEYEKFVCGVELDLSDPDHKTIKIVFCQSWDVEAFFDQLWELDVTESQLRNKYENIYNNFSSIADFKGTIKNFFHLMMNILSIIDFPLLTEISQDGKRLKDMSSSKLLTMATNAQEKNNHLHSILIAYNEDHFNGHKDLLETYQNKDPLSYFKIAMQENNTYSLGKIDLHNVPFLYFYNLYHCLQILQDELKVFLTPQEGEQENKKHQELLEKLQENKQAINDFLKIKQP